LSAVLREALFAGVWYEVSRLCLRVRARGGMRMNAFVRRIYPLLRKPVRIAARVLIGPERIYRIKSKWLSREFIYDAEYFVRDIDGPARTSAPTVAASILGDLAPKTAIDVGCGTGALLAQLRSAGCDVIGLEYAEPARVLCHSRGLDVRPFDLVSDSLADNRTYDVAISMEVAEHLPETVADRYVDLLAFLGKTIVFTAALPGQGGTGHINEQPHEYWIEKFEKRDRVLDWTLTSRWREVWKDSGAVQSWYYNNLMVFRAARTAASPFTVSTSTREPV
jgi:SAM-dependent methyltransferase